MTQLLNVSASKKETYTGITLETGEAIQLTASGQWNIYNDPRRSCGPAGSGVPANNGSTHQPWPQTGISEGCLLVYLNESVATHFDNNGPVIVTGPGRLSFGPNDNFVGDNVGALIVQLTLPAPETKRKSRARVPASRRR